MRDSSFDKKFIEFPLYCLKYCNDDKDKLEDIILFCVVDAALKTNKKTNIDFHLVKTKDFDIEDVIHKRIASAGVEFNFGINSMERAIDVWLELKPIILDYEAKYGKDAFCRMGKQLSEDVINNKFGFREYKVLAAIQSILGKRRPFLRITYEQISYRILGYKKKGIAINEGKEEGALSSQQIKTSIIKLTKKNLLTTVTYMRRQKYYSTKIKKKEILRELVASKKLKDFEIRCGKEDYEWSKKTKKQMMIMFTLR